MVWYIQFMYNTYVYNAKFRKQHYVTFGNSNYLHEGY